MVLCMLKLYITFTASLHWNPGLEINTISSSGILVFFSPFDTLLPSPKITQPPFFQLPLILQVVKSLILEFLIH